MACSCVKPRKWGLWVAGKGCDLVRHRGGISVFDASNNDVVGVKTRFELTRRERSSAHAQCSFEPKRPTS